jgi:hypothetical protein
MKTLTETRESIMNKAKSTLKLLFPAKKFNLTFREWDRLVTVRKAGAKDKVFGYIEVSQAKTSFLPVN